jgi:hypothetical protein
MRQLLLLATTALVALAIPARAESVTFNLDNVNCGPPGMACTSALDARACCAGWKSSIRHGVCISSDLGNAPRLLTTGGWNTSIKAGDVLAFVVSNPATNIKRATVILSTVRSALGP